MNFNFFNNVNNRAVESMHTTRYQQSYFMFPKNKQRETYQSFIILSVRVDRMKLPAPHNPEGRRPVWIQSRFMRWTKRKAVIETSWTLSPNPILLAKRITYIQGSANHEIMIVNKKIFKDQTQIQISSALFPIQKFNFYFKFKWKVLYNSFMVIDWR